MNWVSTNIRFPEDQYRKLKIKAAKERKSLAKVVREATTKVIETRQVPKEKHKNTNRLVKEFRRLAKINSKYVPKGFNWVKALREMRYEE